jgi:hypothetical protein
MPLLSPARILTGKSLLLQKYILSAYGFVNKLSSGARPSYGAFAAGRRFDAYGRPCDAREPLFVFRYSNVLSDGIEVGAASQRRSDASRLRACEGIIF